MPFEIKPQTGEITPGDYDVVIVRAVPGTSSNGNDQIKVELEDAEHRYLTDWVTITDKALWRVEQLWRAVGLDWPDDGGTIDESDLVDKRVHITVYEDEYQGRVKPKVGEYAPPVGSDIPNDPAPAAAPEDDSEVPF